MKKLVSLALLMGLIAANLAFAVPVFADPAEEAAAAAAAIAEGLAAEAEATAAAAAEEAAAAARAAELEALDLDADGRIRSEIARPPRTLVPRITNPSLQGNHQCTVWMKEFENIYFFELDGSSDKQGEIERFIDALVVLNRDSSIGPIGQGDILGCAMMTGRIKVNYFSLYIFYALRLLVMLSGVASMVFIMLGGYQYIIGAITENKDQGKKFILNAIIGLIVSTLAWVIVNIVQTFLTG